jgi:hypothetical protein
MASLVRIDLASQQIPWLRQGENMDAVNQYLTGPQGQVELIDTSGWNPRVSE